MKVTINLEMDGDQLNTQFEYDPDLDVKKAEAGDPLHVAGSLIMMGATEALQRFAEQNRASR